MLEFGKGWLVKLYIYERHNAESALHRELFKEWWKAFREGWD